MNSHVLNQFTMAGSSSQPFSKLSATFFDPSEVSADGSPGNLDINEYNFPAQDGTINEAMQGNQANSFWVFPQRISAQGPMMAHSQMNQQINSQNPGRVTVNFLDGFSKQATENESFESDWAKMCNTHLRKENQVPNQSDDTTVKGQWSLQEDRLLLELVEQLGTKKWAQIATRLKGRIGKQCRERWYNHLRPNIKKSCWTEDEEVIFIEAHRLFGNKWSEIAKRLPGRAENTIKNHWNATKKKQETTRPYNNQKQKSNLLLSYIRSLNTASTSSEAVNLNEAAMNPSQGDTESNSGSFGTSPVSPPQAQNEAMAASKNPAGLSLELGLDSLMKYDWKNVN